MFQKIEKNANNVIKPSNAKDTLEDIWCYFIQVNDPMLVTYAKKLTNKIKI